MNYLFDIAYILCRIYAILFITDRGPLVFDILHDGMLAEHIAAIFEFVGIQYRNAYGKGKPVPNHNIEGRRLWAVKVYAI